MDVRAVGFVVEADFTEKWSTPRQSQCVANSGAWLLMEANYEFDHFEPETYVLVMFVFHLNAARAVTLGGQNFATCSAKIRAPKLLAGSVGCFATRSPHRPNPIGLSLSTVVEVDKSRRRIRLRGVDLVVGTPILGILQYSGILQPLAFECYWPKWVEQNVTEDGKAQRPVTLEIPVAIALQLSLRPDRESAWDRFHVACDALRLDPRSRHSQRKYRGVFAHECARQDLIVYIFKGSTVTVLGFWPLKCLPYPLKPRFPDVKYRSPEYVSQLERFVSIIEGTSVTEHPVLET